MTTALWCRCRSGSSRRKLFQSAYLQHWTLWNHVWRCNNVRERERGGCGNRRATTVTHRTDCRGAPIWDPSLIWRWSTETSPQFDRGQFNGLLLLMLTFFGFFWMTLWRTEPQYSKTADEASSCRKLLVLLIQFYWHFLYLLRQLVRLLIRIFWICLIDKMNEKFYTFCNVRPKAAKIKDGVAVSTENSTFRARTVSAEKPMRCKNTDRRWKFR